MEISVLKRSGKIVPLQIDKWQAQVAKVCKGVSDVSQSMIEIKAQPQFFDGITTRQIDDITLRAIVDLIDVESNPGIGHVNYQYVAGKQRLSMLRKDVYSQYDPLPLFDIIKRNINSGLYTSELLEWYSEDEWEKMDSFVDHDKDEAYSYAAIEQLVSKYLVRNRVTGEIYESPQVRYIVASAVVMHNEPKNTRMKHIKEYYQAASDGLFTLATPVLAGLGTPTKQFSSCFPAGQKVWTSKGEVNIEDIAIGEKVLTHDGSYQKVLATRVQPAPQDSLIQINNVYSLNDEFDCTEDHLIMCLKRHMEGDHHNSKRWSVPHWARADSIKKGDFVQIPYSSYVDPRTSILMTEEFPEVLSYYVLCDDGYLRKPTTDKAKRSGDYDDKVAPFKNEVVLDGDLFRLLGYFAAEGHANKDTYSCAFTLATKETLFIEDISNIIKIKFSLHSTVNHKSDNSTSVIAYSFALRALIKGLVGTGFNDKSLHSTVIRANKANQEEFLIGVIRGDGCVVKNGLSLKMSNRHLIRQISQIMIRVGLSPVLSVLKAEKINEYKINRLATKERAEKVIHTVHDSYGITMSVSGNYEFLKRVDKNNRVKKVGTDYAVHSKRVDGMYFARVRKVLSRKANNVLVYDLQVDNVQSFTVNGVGVHNCVLISADDDLNSIFATGEMMAKYGAKRAGIGLEIGRLRPIGAPVRGGELVHTGMLPFLKKWFGDLRACSQGGIRNSSATVYYPIWHFQFDDLIVLKNNQGTDETRVRHMDYGVVLSAFFWRRFKNQEDITFFDPNQVPDLYQAFYQDIELFEHLYVQYEKRSDLRVKVISAETVFKGLLLKERTDTGRIYILNIDNVQRQGPFDPKAHPIYQSNLCAEIVLPTVPFKRLEDDQGRIALCTLGSINWGAFRNPEDMRRACRTLVRGLNNILEYQDYLSIQSKKSTEEIAPLGIGITNLAYFLAKRGLKYGEADGLAEVKTFMEHQAYYLTEASVQLAKERGACLDSSKTRYGQGIFPWELRADGVNELTDFSPELDWEVLRNDLKVYGIRNSTLMAIAPVESSSVVLNSTNGIEMPMSLITVKESKGGSLIQVVPEYNKLKRKYQLLWDQKDCIEYLKTAAVLAAYVDQSISTNTFVNPRFFPGNKVPTTHIASTLMLGTRWGLKSFYYSLVNKLGAKSLDQIEEVNAIISDVVSKSRGEILDVDFLDEESCESCKL